MSTYNGAEYLRGGGRSGQWAWLGALREVAESGFVGHEVHGFAIFFPVGGFGQINLLKLKGIFWLKGEEHKGFHCKLSLV